jgi:hypothetical protein
MKKPTMNDLDEMINEDFYYIYEIFIQHNTIFADHCFKIKIGTLIFFYRHFLYYIIIGYYKFIRL